MTATAKPIIHLNGTAVVTLVEQYGKAYLAVHAAIVALREAAPHARDYVTSDYATNRYELAVAEHLARLKKLESVLNDLNDIQNHITDHIIEATT